MCFLSKTGVTGFTPIVPGRSARCTPRPGLSPVVLPSALSLVQDPCLRRLHRPGDALGDCPEQQHVQQAWPRARLLPGTPIGVRNAGEKSEDSLPRFPDVCFPPLTSLLTQRLSAGTQPQTCRPSALARASGRSTPASGVSPGFVRSGPVAPQGRRRTRGLRKRRRKH